MKTDNPPLVQKETGSATDRISDSELDILELIEAVKHEFTWLTTDDISQLLDAARGLLASSVNVHCYPDEANKHHEELIQALEGCVESSRCGKSLPGRQSLHQRCVSLIAVGIFEEILFYAEPGIAKVAKRLLRQRQM